MAGFDQIAAELQGSQWIDHSLISDLDGLIPK